MIFKKLLSQTIIPKPYENLCQNLENNIQSLNKETLDNPSKKTFKLNPKTTKLLYRIIFLIQCTIFYQVCFDNNFSYNYM